jgi:hypothetical protein
MQPTIRGLWHLPKNNAIRAFALALLLICLLAGVIHLFILRFEAGDIYPAYSSLRSDPLGSRAFYESLGNFKDIAVQRNFQLLSLLKFEPHTTFLYLGARAAENDLMPESLSEVFERLTQSGGRLVFSFLPVIKKVEENPCLSDKDNPAVKKDLKSGAENPTQKPVCENKSGTSRESSPAKSDKPASRKGATETQFVPISEKWGIGIRFIENLPVKDEKYLALDAVGHRPNLPAAVSWHSNLCFELLNDRWQTLYSINGNPVIVERPIGRGTLVLCADSFFISNEALRSERHPQLLAWLLGRPAKIIFDETHFGIYKQTGVADLLRHYRFKWFFVSLSFLALLFVWKNAVYFVPPRQADTPAGAGVVTEKDFTSGLIALLRRNFADSKVLQICVQEWEQTFKKDKRIRTGASELIKNILRSESQSPKKKTDSVAGYRKLSSAIKRLGIYSRGNRL